MTDEHAASPGGQAITSARDLDTPQKVLEACIEAYCWMCREKHQPKGTNLPEEWVHYFEDGFEACRAGYVRALVSRIHAPPAPADGGAGYCPHGTKINDPCGECIAAQRTAPPAPFASLREKVEGRRAYYGIGCEARNVIESILLDIDAEQAAHPAPSASSVETAERIVREWQEIRPRSYRALTDAIAAALTAERQARESLEDAVVERVDALAQMRLARAQARGLLAAVDRDIAAENSLRDHAARIRAARAGDGGVEVT